MCEIKRLLLLVSPDVVRTPPHVVGTACPQAHTSKYYEHGRSAKLHPRILRELPTPGPWRSSWRLPARGTKRLCVSRLRMTLTRNEGRPFQNKNHGWHSGEHCALSWANTGNALTVSAYTPGSCEECLRTKVHPRIL